MWFHNTVYYSIFNEWVWFSDCFCPLVPTSLDISQQNGVNSRKKKRRKRRPNEGVLDFDSTYKLVGEILGEGAWSKVETCQHRNTKKMYAVKVSGRGLVINVIEGC